MKKTIPMPKIITLGAFILLAGFFVLKQLSKKKTDVITLGILQTASHPSLDEARDSFMQHMKKKLGSKVSFVIQNAEGSMNHAQLIAKSFHTKKSIDGIFAIGTLTAQAIARLEKKKPIFIAAVTDPREAGLMHEKTNVCGSTDMVDVQKQIKDIKEIFPNVKKVAILFNTGEPNSVMQVKKTVAELKKQGLDFIKAGVTNESELATAVKMAIRNADALIAPTDFMVSSAIQMITDLTTKAKKPFIASDNVLVPKGALMASGGVDYKIGGRKAAECAINVLIDGKKPHGLTLATSTDPRIFFNKKVAQQLGIAIPENKDIKLV